MASSAERSPQFSARLAGVLYLAIILLGIFGEMGVRAALVVSGDATATANGIENSQSLWRTGIVSDLLMHVCDVPVAVLLYLLLKPVSKSIAMFATCFALIQTAVLVVNKLNLLFPLFLLGDASYLKAFSPEQLHALSYLAIKAHGYGFGIGLIFFGFTCLAWGYLICRSGYLPRTVGVLMVLAGMGYLTNGFAMLLAPAIANSISPGALLPAFVGELSLSVWLITKGVNIEQWKRRVPAAQPGVPADLAQMAAQGR
jgi:hypothetical protein